MNNSEVFHSWAHQHKLSAKGSNCSYNGNICYSYSTPIGMLVEKNGKTLTILSSERFSVTTSKHQSLCFRAIHTLYPYVNVNNLRNLIDVSIDNLLQRLEIYHSELLDDIISKLSNKRKKAINILHLIIAEYHELKALYNFLDKDLTDLSSKIIFKINESGRFDINFSSMDHCKNYFNDVFYNRRSSYSQKTQEEIIENWRKCKRQSINGLKLTKTLLRFSPKNNQVQTSKGISFSTDEARQFWSDIQDSVIKNVEKTVKYLGFEGKINPDGSVSIGCHSIDYSEILNIASTLGFTNESNLHITL